MHPLSTALFLLGYSLALPIGSRLPSVVAGQNRLAMWGHQTGVLLAGVGWLLRGQILMAVVHAAWLIGASVWFGLKTPRRSPPGR